MSARQVSAADFKAKCLRIIKQMATADRAIVDYAAGGYLRVIDAAQ